MALTSPTSTPPPMTFRQYVTLTRPDLPQGRVVEYPVIPGNKLFSTPQTGKVSTIVEQTSKISSIGESWRKDSPLRLYRDATIRLPALRDAASRDVTSRPASFPSRYVGSTSRNSSPAATNSRNRKLENVNLRGVRRPSRASTWQGATGAASSSCKQSDSTNNDSQKSTRTSESLDVARPALESSGKSERYEVEQMVEVLTEEELERRQNIVKCMNWIENLPAKFSGMHIAQERAPVTHD